MATLKKTPAAQTVLAADFTFNIADADAMVNTSGVLTPFKNASGTVYDIISLPYGAQVVGGDMVVITISNDTGTATAALGDSASATRYLAATTIKTAARTALTITGYQSLGEAVRLTLANANGDATAGKVKFQVQVIFAARATENLKTV